MAFYIILCLQETFTTERQIMSYVHDKRCHDISACVQEYGLIDAIMDSKFVPNNLCKTTYSPVKFIFFLKGLQKIISTFIFNLVFKLKECFLLYPHSVT